MKEVAVYTDGSSRGNPGPGGYGALLIYGKHRKELSRGYVKTTNNRMEMMAVIAALDLLKEPCEVTITTDSRYIVDAMTKNWLKGWKSRGWITAKKEPVKNADLWRLIDAHHGEHQLHFNWVKGHAGHDENERCDELATTAADGGDLVPDEGYEASLKSDQAGLF